MRRPTIRRRRRAAFTLMEVLLVVAILLILGSIVVVSFSGIMAGAEEDNTKVQLDNVAKAVQLYKFQCRVAPGSVDDLVANQNSALEGKWRGPYLPETPNDAWGQPITISQGTTTDTFKVSSPGDPGGQKGPIEKEYRY
jgi:general secretion pathway protein G